MKETDLYMPIVAGLLDDGHLVFKIVDGSLGKKPFDIAGISKQGRGIGLEIKIASQVSEAEGPSWRLFRTHQITWLRAYAKNGAFALAAIYCMHTCRLYVWSMSSASDRCVRNADLILRRNSDEHFYGWNELIKEQEVGRE